MKRRAFLQKLGTATAAAAAVSYPGKSTHAAVRTRWRMVMSWPLHFPILGESMDRLAADVASMSKGRFTIKVFGGGELVPPLGVFDAVSAGTVQMGNGAAYYWSGKAPAAAFFTNVPFGMNAQQTNAWLDPGGGLDLWRELYAPHRLVPFAVGNTGVQMGGWFRKPLNGVGDIRGLKMRMPGLGGKVFSKTGGTVVLLPGGEILPALERGVIDATEWVGPYLDTRLGLYQAAKHYYYPGWQEPSAIVEMTVNAKAWKSLPRDYQAIVETAAGNINGWALAAFDARNAQALKTLADKHGIKPKRFPDELIKAFRKNSDEVLGAMTSKYPKARKIYDHYKNFQDTARTWARIGEEAVSYAKSLG